MSEIPQYPTNYPPYAWPPPYAGYSPLPYGPYIPPSPGPWTWNPFPPHGPISHGPILVGTPPSDGGTRGLSPADFSNEAMSTQPSPTISDNTAASTQLSQNESTLSPTLSFSQTERIILKKALDILKTFPAGETSSDRDKQKLISVLCYLSGFLEAKGATQSTTMLDGFVMNGEEPTLATQYDAIVKNLELIINGSSDTRNPVLIAIAVGVAGNALWDGIKAAYHYAID